MVVLDKIIISMVILIILGVAIAFYKLGKLTNETDIADNSNKLIKWLHKLKNDK